MSTPRTSTGKIKRKNLTETMVRIVAASQQWQCAICKILLPANFQVDHIVALCNGGEDNRSNYQAVCGTCHCEKTFYDTLQDEKYFNFLGESKEAYHTRQKEKTKLVPLEMVPLKMKLNRAILIPPILNQFFDQFKFRPKE